MIRVVFGLNEKKRENTGRLFFHIPLDGILYCWCMVIIRFCCGVRDEAGFQSLSLCCNIWKLFVNGLANTGLNGCEGVYLFLLSSFSLLRINFMTLRGSRVNCISNEKCYYVVRAFTDLLEKHRVCFTQQKQT